MMFKWAVRGGLWLEIVGFRDWLGGTLGMCAFDRSYFSKQQRLHVQDTITSSSIDRRLGVSFVIMAGPSFGIVEAFVAPPDLPQILHLFVRHISNTIVTVLDKKSKKSKSQEHRESRT